MRTGLITKGDLDDATTTWAQGGVAAALGAEALAVDSHLADTLAAGAGLCDFDATRILVDEGPRRVEELIALGAIFDRDSQGRLELAREGGHSVPRVVHAGGAATGAEIERTLVDAVRRTAVVIHTRTFLEDLVMVDGVCRGAWCRFPDGSRRRVRARNVLLAAGGAGQLFSVTTNPTGATGDGVAAAMRAGAAVTDLEFFQFHPTALRHDRSPRPLLTEALRGHGAVLRNASGERFVDELLPRDVVSRAILTEMATDGSDQVWLDARELESFGTRFPTIAEVLASVGLDPGHDLLPVHPAAHHLCGGVLTDLDGATTIDGLWACGEVACTGVHGANRLASNSLLEGMVFAPRAVEAMIAGRTGARMTGAMAGLEGPDGLVQPDRVEESGDPVGMRRIELTELPIREAPSGAEVDRAAARVSVAALLERLQRAMTAGAGVRRSSTSLKEVDLELSVVAAELSGVIRSEGADPVAAAELSNLATLAHALVSVAAAREESRGTHWREDHPETDPRYRVRYLVGSGPKAAGHPSSTQGAVTHERR
jgi:L-aspartate oxidase